MMHGATSPHLNNALSVEGKSAEIPRRMLPPTRFSPIATQKPG